MLWLTPGSLNACSSPCFLIGRIKRSASRKQHIRLPLCRSIFSLSRPSACPRFRPSVYPSFPLRPSICLCVQCLACFIAAPISPLHKKKKNSTSKVFNSNFISTAPACKLTQQPLESKVTLGSPLTVLYANICAPGQWSGPAERLLMQI